MCFMIIVYFLLFSINNNLFGPDGKHLIKTKYFYLQSMFVISVASDSVDLKGLGLKDVRVNSENLNTSFVYGRKFSNRKPANQTV